MVLLGNKVFAAYNSICNLCQYYYCNFFNGSSVNGVLVWSSNRVGWTWKRPNRMDFCLELGFLNIGFL